MNNEVMFSSKSKSWGTPDRLFQTLDELFGPFNLDAAANFFNTKCKKYYSVLDDALTQKWEGKVFLNPPYGRGIGDWIKKAHDEVRVTRNAEVVCCLLPSRTDTKWFHEFCMKANIIFLMVGRVKFLSSGYPKMVPNDELLFLNPGPWTEGSLAGAPFPSIIVVFNSVEFKNPPTFLTI